MTKYYVYDPATLIYTTTVDAVDQPANSSVWPPRCLDDDTQDSYFDGVGWITGRKRSELTLAALQAAAVDEAALTFKNAVAALKTGYTAEETDSWDTQAADAAAFMDTGKASPFLQALATARGQTVEALANSITDKATAYASAYAAALGSHQAARNAVAAFTDIADIPVTKDMLWRTNLIR